MDLETAYTFVPLASKNYIGYHDKRTQELLSKWGIQQNISIQSFSFNEPFQPYLKYHLAESFFKDPVVAKELKTKSYNSWCNEEQSMPAKFVSSSEITLAIFSIAGILFHQRLNSTDGVLGIVARFHVKGIVATQVTTEQIPCSVLAMSFFDKLKDPDNNITYDSNKIRKTMTYNEEGDMITDNLKAMLLDPECPEYTLYEEDERKELIFRIMQMLVLGGKLCQYEDVLEPYLDITKALYKDLVRVDKLKESKNLSISTMVLKVVAMNSGNPYFPRNINETQNFAFLLVDSASRQVTTFLHQLDEQQKWEKF